MKRSTVAWNLAEWVGGRNLRVFQDQHQGFSHGLKMKSSRGSIGVLFPERKVWVCGDLQGREAKESQICWQGKTSCRPCRKGLPVYSEFGVALKDTQSGKPFAGGD